MMITKKQLLCVIINAIVVKMLVTFPRTMFVICANSAWIAAILSTVVAFALFSIISGLWNGKLNLIGLSEKIGGTPLRIITGICVLAVLSLNIMTILRIFPEFIRLVLLQKTYVEIISFVFIIVVIFGASQGIESIARVHMFFLPIAGIMFASFIIMLIPEINFEFILPIFGNGAMSIFKGTMSCLSIFTDLLLLNILIPQMKETDNYKQAGKKGIVYGGICAVLILLIYGLCYVYPTSTKFIVPIYQLERMINLSDFFSRLEALFQFIWSISVLLYTCLYINVTAEVFRETFGLSHVKPLIAPIIIVIFAISSIPSSLNDIIHLESVINKWIYIPSFVLPALVVVFSKMFHVKHLNDKNECFSQEDSKKGDGI